jgi:AcrR family transcriptional regulator
MATRRMSRGERRAETRDRLLEAAGRVFARLGYHRASVEEVAAEAGFSTGALYSNFAGKEDLFLALLEAQIRRHSEELAEAVAEAATVEDRAHGAARHWMAFLEREPEMVLLFMEFWALAVRDPEVRGRFAARYADVRATVSELIERGAADLGVELVIPAEQLAAAVDALADGIALQKLADPEAIPDELFGRILSLLLAGASRPAS